MNDIQKQILVENGLQQEIINSFNDQIKRIDLILSIFEGLK